MAADADPTLIQAPGLFKADGHDLPVAQERPAIHKSLQAVLDLPALSAGHELVKERVNNPYERFCPMYINDLPLVVPNWTPYHTYLGATLMALCNVSPLLNFLDEAERKKAFSDPFIDALTGLARSFRGWQPGEEAEKDQQKSVISRFEIMREYTNGMVQGQPALTMDSGFHCMDFIDYLFRKIQHAQLMQGSADGNTLSTQFEQLFKYYTVRHTPMRCRCSQPVLRRQDTQHAQPSGYYIKADISKATNLDQAISRAMWETTAIERTCPVCGVKVTANDFDKFAYLPEVFFVLTHFIDKSGGPGNYKFPTDEKLTYPEWLDMSAFRDDPARPGDQTDCTYKLQSIVTSSNADGDRETSYKTAVRVSENEFAQFRSWGYAAEHLPDYVTFEEINQQKDTDVPHLLIYVRERHPEAAGNSSGAATSQSNPPQGHPPHTVIPPKPTLPQDDTNKAVPPIPTQPGSQKNQPDSFNLKRFVDAQNQRSQPGNITAFELAKSELRGGRKTTHWMWYMFPQVVGLSQSETGIFYSIKSLAEARAYWNHPTLKIRYLQLLDIVLNDSKTDLSALFDDDAEKFQASLTLFLYVCISNNEQTDYLEKIFEKFQRSKHIQTLNVYIPWLDAAGEGHAIVPIASISGVGPHSPEGGGDGKQETTGQGPGISSMVTTTGTVSTTPADHNKAGAKTEEPTTPRHPGAADIVGYENDHGFAQRIGYALMSLADQELPADDPQWTPEMVSVLDLRGRTLGRLILDYGLPHNAHAPVATADSEERARRLGRHLMSLSLPAPDGRSDAGSYEEPGGDYSPDDGSGDRGFGSTSSGFGFDGSSDEQGDGAGPDEEELFQAIAIPTDPDDPRIEACKTWPLEDLKVAFQKEQLDWRGLKSDRDKHMIKFLKHFELERDYSIYHEVRLRQAIKDRGIPMRHGVNKADKAELVDALTDYDVKVLQGLGYVEQDQSDETESISIRYETEPYESSEASGNEAWYIEQERAALSASRKGGATPGRATARSQKRLRDEDDDYEDDEDEEDEGQEITPRASHKPVRMRTRY